MTIVTSRDAYEALAKVLGLPKYCTSFKLVGHAGEALTLNVTSFVDTEEFKGFVETIEAFDLVKREQVSKSCISSISGTPPSY